jgi:broad specificity phosphatase PhoE
MSSHLILVKHSLPDLKPGIPANQWLLSIEGCRRCHPLAEKLAPYNPEIMRCSQEPKAEQTAQIVAKALHLAVESYPGLHEHERRYVPFLSKETLEESVRRFFEHPDQRVFGEESASEAARRFGGSINCLLAAFPGTNLVIVAHGTVISLYISETCHIDPYNLWKRLGLPSFVVLSPSDAEIIDICEAVQ